MGERPREGSRGLSVFRRKTPKPQCQVGQSLSLLVIRLEVPFLGSHRRALRNVARWDLMPHV